MTTKSEADWPHEPRAVDRRRAVQLIADRTLIEAVARGEATAIESLVHRFAGRITCFLITRAVPPQLARRLTVDVLADAIAGAADYDGSAGIYSWLRRLALQQLLDITQQAHRRWPLQRHPLLDQLSPSELEWLVRTTRIDQIGFATRALDPPLDSLREHVTQLPRPQREVLVAYYGDNQSLESISGQLHRGEAAVRNLLDQALFSLAEAGGMTRRVRSGEQNSAAGVAAEPAVSSLRSSAARSNDQRDSSDTVPLRHNFLAASRRERVTEIDLWTGLQAAPDELSLVADWLGLEESVHLVFHRSPITTAEVTLRRRLRPTRYWRSWLLSAAATAALALLAVWQMRSGDLYDTAPLDRSPEVVAQRDLPGQDFPGPDQPATDAEGTNRPADDAGGAAALGGSGVLPGGPVSADAPDETPSSGSAGVSDDRRTDEDQWVPFGDDEASSAAESSAAENSASGGSATSDPTRRDRSWEPAAPAVPSPGPPADERSRPVPAVAARQIDDLAAWRQRLYELVYARDWIALRDWTLGTDFQGSATQRQWGQALARWGAAMARVEGNPELVKTGKLALALVDRSHHQQTYDAMQEYFASLEAETDDEFVRLHRRFQPARYPGLIPWPGDPEQLVTAWGASELGGVLRPVALSESTLAAARIDVARRLRSARPSTVRELARQYAGQPAVGRVYEWMAERSLEAMRWADARQFIELAGAVDSDHAERWQAWRSALDRLQGRVETRGGAHGGAKVDWGRSWGPPAVLPATWWQEAGSTSDASDAHRLASNGPSAEVSAVSAIRPVRWEVAGPPRSTGLKWIDQPAGVDALRVAAVESPGLMVDQRIGTSVQNLLYLSGADQCMAWDPIAGRSVWSYAAPVRPVRPPASTAGSPVRAPVIDGDRVVVTLGPQCYCLERESGELIWRTLFPANMQAVSAPVIRPDRYSWLALSSDDGEMNVHLVHLDPFTGHILRSHELFRLQNSWHVFQQCEVAEMGSYLAVSWGGATSVFDLDGNLYWVRETTGVQPSVDPYLGRVARQAPVVSATHVWSWQAGAPVIDCCELRTGRRVWRSTLADLQRCIGATDKLLVFQLQHGLVGLDRMTGQIVWQRRVSPSWGPVSWENGAGQVLVVTQSAPSPTDPPAWSAHWVNLADGRLVTSWPLNFGSDSVRELNAVLSQPSGLSIAGVKTGETEVKIWPLAVRS